MKRVFCFCIASVFISSLLFAQPATTKQVAIGTGISWYAQRSELFSPLLYTGSSLPMQFSFRMSGVNSRHHVQINYTSNSLESASKALLMNERIGSFQYAYFRKVKTLAGNLTLHVGLVLDFQGSRRSSVTNTSNVENVQNGEAYTSLSPTLYLEKDAGKGIVSAQVWPSLVGIINQPGYALSYPDKTDVVSIGTFRKVEGRISYHRPLSFHWGYRLDYQFQAYHVSTYETFTSLNHQLILSVSYQFH